MQQRVRTRALKADTSLLASRPRRICRLPSRFDDHSISPSKFIPLQPTNASTPIQQSKAKSRRNNDSNVKKTKSSANKQSPVSKPTRSAKASALQKKINGSTDKNSPDTNNNAKTRSTRARKAQSKPQTSKTSNTSNSNSSPQISPIKKLSPKPTIAKKVIIKSTTSTKVGHDKNNDKSLSIIAISPRQSNKFFNRTASPQSSPVKNTSPKTKNKRVLDKSLSFKVLGGKRTRENEENDDIYEFTFDPNEEPQPQKKKRKKTTTKKTVKVTKPKKTVTYKTTYDQNINKALSALKNIVKPSKVAEVAALPKIQEISNEQESAKKDKQNHTMNDTGKTSVHECNYPSIRVEDIAADIEPSIDHGDDLNYSPVNSPRPASPKHASLNPRRTSVKHVNDPLNLQEDLSFFDDVPVASSSMNVSVRHPLASPWRVEFGNLPIRWHSNTYVKPNMTPAVESSFICSEESNKRKHVYTNMVPETNDLLPQIVSNTSLKQPSIIEFIKEVAERQAKKKRGRSKSPTKAAAEMHNFDINNITPPEQRDIPTANTSGEVSSNSTNDKENSKEERQAKKRKNNENISDRPAKSPRKEKDKDCTFFGFDESESINQENISPVKVTNKGRSLRAKRPALQEINGPTRAVFPVNKPKTDAIAEPTNFEDNENQDQENTSPTKIKSKGRTLRSRTKVLQEINGPAKGTLPVAVNSKPVPGSEAVDKVFEEVNTAMDAPEFLEEEMDENMTNIDDPTYDDDSQSVHLFEDIEVVHHLKGTRKSYGKAKKVTFCQKTVNSDASEDAVPENNDASFDDDFGDFTFEIPNIQEKKKAKKRPKKLMSKKEEKEAEEWAAGFNSMCEEIEEFPLVVE